MWFFLAVFCYLTVFSSIFLLAFNENVWSKLFGFLLCAGLFLLVWRVNSLTLESGLILSPVIFEPFKDLKRNKFSLKQAWREKDGEVFPLRLSLFWTGFAIILLAGVAVMVWQILLEWNSYTDGKRMAFSFLFVFFLILALFGKIR